MGKPRIRFKGFDNDWEQRKFSEFVNNVARKNKDNLDLEPYAVTNDRGFIAQKDAHDDFGYMKETDRRAYNIVPPNSFAYNPARINVGSLGYYTGSENVIVSSLYEVFQTEDYIDDRFLWHWLKSNHFPKWIEKLQEGSVRLYFYFDKLVQCQMMVPTIKEQKQISTYFDSIDHLITLHQRECEDTKKLKKYMLQKMFPQNVSKVPEIRFKGFTDDWEQRKVSDLLQERNEQAPMSEEYPLMAFIANQGVAPKGERYDRSALVNDEIGKKYKRTEYGDFIYSSNNLETGSVGLNKYGNACISPVYSIFKPTGNADLDFLGRRFLRKDFINEMVKWRQGVVYGQWKIHESDFLNINVAVPSLEEQKRIGQYFEKLDHLITLHHRKLIYVKNTSKFTQNDIIREKL